MDPCRAAWNQVQHLRSLCNHDSGVMLCTFEIFQCMLLETQRGGALEMLPLLSFSKLCRLCMYIVLPKSHLICFFYGINLKKKHLNGGDPSSTADNFGPFETGEKDY